MDLSLQRAGVYWDEGVVIEPLDRSGAVSVAYDEFIASKARRVPERGVHVDPADLHPALYDFQRSITSWALRKGSSAIFADCGLGKTIMQCEWVRQVADTTLIVAPLSVARQTVNEAKLIDLDVTYVRDGEDVTGPGVWITNYEMIERFDPDLFGAVVLDESSLLKNVDGKTRQRLTEQFRSTPYRLACTATPAPNDVSELVNHADFLGIMPRHEMLAAYFIHDDEGWRLKGHAAEAMYEWMASWAIALRRPSDIGYPDEGFDLPALRIVSEIIRADIEAEGQLFATELGGVGGRAKVRRQTLDARVKRAAELAMDDNQWIVWCGLNDEARSATDLIEGAVNVEGNWSPEDKAEALESFQDGAIRVLVTKPSIAGFGMNFQNCSRMAFLGLSDSYESYYQSIRRCWRYGQTEPVSAHLILSDLEEQIAFNVRRKEVESQHTTNRLIAHASKELHQHE